MTDIPDRSNTPLIGPRTEAALARLPFLSRILAAEPRDRAPGEARREVAVALAWGAATHLLFALAVGAMIAVMSTGMTAALGAVPQPWAWGVNLLLLLQFPAAHSFLLTRRGMKLLGRIGPPEHARTLATSTYAMIASVQLLALFLLWTPSGAVWWAAQGWALAPVLTAYALSWLFLMKASWDAGAEVQSGLLGWASLFRGVRPPFPPMPATGTFRVIRQPIYLAFALTTWTVPVWTPDQLMLAIVLTGYCALGPLMKERRFDRMFGERWRAYRAATPFWVPGLKGRAS